MLKDVDSVTEEKILELSKDLNPTAETIPLVTKVLKRPDSVLGLTMTHAWDDDGEKKMFNGRILKFKKQHQVKISYWGQNESEDAAVDYDLSLNAILVDILCGDLVFHK